MRILLIDPDVEAANKLAGYLKGFDFAVDIAKSLSETKGYINHDSVDLIIAERQLTDGDSINLIEYAKIQSRPLRLMLLSHIAESQDRIECLESGALDYIAKPYSSRELLARIRNCLRIPVSFCHYTIKFGDLSYDRINRTFTLCDQLLLLRRTELLVLESLMLEPGQIVSRNMMENHVYGNSKKVSYTSLEPQISRIRKYFTQRQSSTIIKTVRGVGYALCTQSGD